MAVRNFHMAVYRCCDCIVLTHLQNVMNVYEAVWRDGIFAQQIQDRADGDVFHIAATLLKEAENNNEQPLFDYEASPFTAEAKGSSQMLFKI